MASIWQLAREGDSDKKHPVMLFRTKDGFLIHTFENYKWIGCPMIFWDMGENPWPHHYLSGDLSTCIAFSPDSQKLAVSYYDATRLYNVANKSEEGIFTAGRPWFSDNGQFSWIDSHLKQSIGIDLATKQHMNYPPTLDYSHSSHRWEIT